MSPTRRYHHTDDDGQELTMYQDKATGNGVLFHENGL